LFERVWVHRILKGDRAAGQQFVTRHYAAVYRLLRHLTGRPEVAEDLTQQAFVRAWQALPNFRGGSSLATWLHRIAYREYTHWLRSRRDHAPLEDAEWLPDRSAGGELEALAFRRALEELPEEQRDAFLLCQVEGFSVREASQVLQAPEGTVKWRVFDARQRLRRLLAEPEEVLPHEMSQARAD
jgi:RNA polymerase sigma-70 factor (ECF subfamily)